MSAAGPFWRGFRRPKRGGGFRDIAAPSPRLKAAQRWIARSVLARHAAHDVAHGFVTGRSTVTNAAPHVGAAVVVCVDIRGFFPSISRARIACLFYGLGVGASRARSYALVCAGPDGQLPQGSPASPGLTNLLCRRMDRRLAGLARKLGFAFTRYADDLTFSHRDAGAAVAVLLRDARRIVHGEGFRINGEKTTIARRGERQEVTGIIVNDRASVGREARRRLRAFVHRLETEGPPAVTWGGSRTPIAAAMSYAAHAAHVDPEVCGPLFERIRELTKGHR